MLLKKKSREEKAQGRMVQEREPLEKVQQEKELRKNERKKTFYLPDRIKELEDCLIIDDIYYRLMVIEAMPELLQFGWFNRITVIPGVTVSVLFYPYEHEEASRRVGKRQTEIGAELILAQKNFDSRRIGQLNVKYSYYQKLLTDINLHRDNIASVTAVISVSGKTREEMEHRSNLVKNKLGAMKAVTLMRRQLQGLKTLLPLVDSHVGECHDVTIACAACLSPLISTDFSHPSGIFFGRNLTGSPVFLDSFIGAPRLYGPHMFVTGTTRSGKSFTCKGVVSRSAACGMKVVVLDPEGEYRKEAEALGGEYIRFHPNMEVMFNPFDIEPEYDDRRKVWFNNIAGKQDDIVYLIAAMLEVQTGEKMTAEERALAAKAVRDEYFSRGITEDPESIYEPGGVETGGKVRVGKKYKEMPTLSSYMERLRGMGATRLANILLNYCRGGPQGFFDGQSIGKFYEAPLVVFDVSGLQTEFSRTYAMYVMLSWIWEKFVKKNRETRKRVLVDEAWLFMKHKDTAEFLSQMARRGAKYNTSLMVASQSFREFTSQEGMALLAQCDTKFFLRMQTTDAEALGEMFKLPKHVVEWISSFPQGRGILTAGNESAVVDFVGFAFEEQFLRSDPEAVLAR
ncbi:AAA-like domain-containing protein [Desulfofundulus australicus DSM 11792]|uniref:AAA-like domain-containing protein n=1 Tax=Desulfofundulus australicus DSM 11792 TaxID=1121425 RepID=A0A1M4XYK0_9FIRM|nr:ATP-binding protein [Desulfofundulus australicus]SHE98519.1 AAA-like domain-containing protein [Desulfofundulus australicus DSM 11792]